MGKPRVFSLLVFSLPRKLAAEREESTLFSHHSFIHSFIIHRSSQAPLHFFFFLHIQLTTTQRALAVCDKVTTIERDVRVRESRAAGDAQHALPDSLST